MLLGVASLDENMNVSDTLQNVLGVKETLEKDMELLRKGKFNLQLLLQN